MKILIIGCGYLAINFILFIINKNSEYEINVVSDKVVDDKVKNLLKSVNFYNYSSENIESIIKNKKIDVIIHTNSTTVPLTSNNNLKYDINSNLIRSINIFEISAISKVKKIIFLSSSGAIYDNSNEIKTEKSDLNPVTSYGIIKITTEMYLKLIAEKYKISAISLRISNPYGGFILENKNKGFINKLLFCIKNDKLINLWGDGNACKDFIHVKDVSKAIHDAILVKSNYYDVFNIAYGKSYRLNEILDYLKYKCEVNLKIEFISKNETDIDKVLLSIKNASSGLNWKPEINLLDYLKRKIEINN